jgi:hypothetical protein
VSDLDRMILNGVRPQAPAMAIAAPLNDLQLVILVAAIFASRDLRLDPCQLEENDPAEEIRTRMNATTRESALVEAEQLLVRAIQRAKGANQ